MAGAGRVSALFCGTVRNAGPSLGRGLDRLDLVRARFAWTRAVIVTNDNTDDTEAILAQWVATDPARNTVLRADGLARSHKNRIDRICAARNLYLDAIRDDLASGDWDYVIVADLDGPNETLDPEWFDRLDKIGFDWAGLFANQDQYYYDIYALRHDRWCPGDCWQEVETRDQRLFGLIPLPGFIGYQQAVDRFVHARQHHIPPDHPPIPVRSAFGGLGIYRAGALAGLAYSSRRPDGTLVCEHVPLHEAITSRGGRLFILPDLVNTTPAGHISSASGTPFPEY